MILLLYGQDTFGSRQKLKEIKDRFREKNQDDLNFIELVGETLKFQDFLSALFSVSLLPSSRLVVIKNFFTAHGGSKLEKEILEKLKEVDSSTVLVFYEEGEIKASPLFKFLNKPKLTQRFDLPQRPEDLKKWIAKEVGRQGAGIDERAALALVEATGPDTHRLANEIAKLTAYAKEITAEMVGELVTVKTQRNVFTLLDGIAEKKGLAAYVALRELLDQGEYPPALFSLISKQIENLLKIKDLKNRGLREAEIAAELKIHPYVVKKSARAVDNFSLGELLGAFSLLTALDLKIRRGEIEAENALELFILEQASLQAPRPSFS